MKKLIFIVMIVAMVSLTGSSFSNNKPPGQNDFTPGSVLKYTGETRMSSCNTTLTTTHDAVINQNEYCLPYSDYSFGVMQRKNEAIMCHRQNLYGMDTKLIVNYSFASKSNTGNLYFDKGGAILHRMQKAELMFPVIMSFNTNRKSAETINLTGGTNLYRILKLSSIVNASSVKNAPVY